MFNQKGNILIIGIGIGLLIIAVGFIAYSLTKKDATSQFDAPISKNSVPDKSPLATIIPNKQVENLETFSNTKYGISFQHPGLDDKCCSISGSLVGNPDVLATFADLSTVKEGTDTPFNGFSVSVVKNTYKEVSEYINAEKEKLNSNSFCGGVKSTDLASISNNAGTVIKCQNGLNEYIVLFPNMKYLLVIDKKESSPGSFDTTFSQILNSIAFAN